VGGVLGGVGGGGGGGVGFCFLGCFGGWLLGGGVFFCLCLVVFLPDRNGRRATEVEGEKRNHSITSHFHATSGKPSEGTVRMEIGFTVSLGCKIARARRATRHKNTTGFPGKELYPLGCAPLLVEVRGE